MQLLRPVLLFVFAIVRRFPIWTAIGVFALGGYLLRDFTTGSVTGLKVGDCFDVPTGDLRGTVLKDVQHHPCGDAHSAELIFIGSVPGTDDSFPGIPSFTAYAKKECAPAFQSYIGRSYEADTTYDLTYLYPTSDGWKKGDRGITCFVTRVDGKPITGTVRVSR